MSADSFAATDHDEAPSSGGVDRLRAAWGRRKWLAVFCFALPFTAAVALIMSLPDIYRSAATVLVERQQVPESFVRATVTSELETRLNSISQEILSRSRLEALITRFRLYQDVRAGGSMEDAIERMRNDIRLELRDSADGRGRNTMVAFGLSFRGHDPQTVAMVANTLASYYIEENLKVRERQATGTSEFLRVQLQDVRRRLDEQERQVGALREKYMGELPQEMQSNLTTLESLQTQLRMNNDNQVRAVERRQALNAELADAAAMSQTATGVQFETPEMRLARLKQELANLRIKYTDRWPDIIRIKDEIAGLEKELAQKKPEKKNATVVAEDSTLPPTPYVLRTREALRTVETELRLMKAEEQRLRAGIAAYLSRVQNTPKREQEFKDVTRDYESTREQYASLLKRYEEAQLAESMEQRQKGEQFRILDSAVPSGTPAAPNRPRFLAMALALSAGFAVAMMFVAEMLDTSFHSVDDLKAFSSVPVLVSIPRIVTPRDSRRRRARFRLVAAGALVLLVAVAGVSVYVGHGNENLVRLLGRERTT
jgi:polysaccharide chain length determinant protein (PEP-CTERM system associated)